MLILVPGEGITRGCRHEDSDATLGRLLVVGSCLLEAREAVICQQMALIGRLGPWSLDTNLPYIIVNLPLLTTCVIVYRYQVGIVPGSATGPQITNLIPVPLSPFALSNPLHAVR